MKPHTFTFFALANQVSSSFDASFRFEAAFSMSLEVKLNAAIRPLYRVDEHA